MMRAMQRTIVLCTLFLAACMATTPPTPPAQDNVRGLGDGHSWKTFAKPSDAQLRSMLNEEQYDVTQREGTEPAFQNTHWDEHRDGIYVDVVSGEPLFS